MKPPLRGVALYRSPGCTTSFGFPNQPLTLTSISIGSVHGTRSVSPCFPFAMTAPPDETLQPMLNNWPPALSTWIRTSFGADAMGTPHFGHVGALSETSEPHSGHEIRATVAQDATAGDATPRVRAPPSARIHVLIVPDRAGPQWLPATVEKTPVGQSGHPANRSASSVPFFAGQPFVVGRSAGIAGRRL
jgi:hypothetical protein